MTARVPLIERRSDLAPEHHGVFDAIAQSRGRIAGPFAVMLHSPVVADRAGQLGAYIRFESTLSAADRELAVIAAAREMDCAYEWAYHAPLARQAGVREEAITVVRERGLLGRFTTAEAEIVDYVRQVLRRHQVDETLFAALRTRLGVQGLVELTATVGYYTMLACTLNAFAVTPEPGTEPLPD
ncbi:MAG: carboxymuconolactone decarboxylase family protein [Candidatus Rokuibacteriota bacterium]